MTVHGSRADAEDQLARLHLERDGTSASTPTVAEVWASYVKPGLAWSPHAQG